MLGLFMYRHIATLQILIGCGDIRVASLVTGNDNTFSIGQVTYS